MAIGPAKPYTTAGSGRSSNISLPTSTFLLSLLDGQATTKPTGWISCGLRQGRDDRIVDIVFENAECAKAFIDGVEPTVGPIVAATRMCERCVSMIREMSAEWDIDSRDPRADLKNLIGVRGKARADAALEIIKALESLTLDGEKEQ